MGTKLHGGQILAKALKKEGVTKVFTLAGDHTMTMYYGLIDEGIEVIDFRHESAAVCAALGYSRATGRPAVVVVTAGPGACNAIGALMDGVCEGSPIMVISGGSPVKDYMTGAMQEVDLIPMYRTITTWAERVYDVKRIADYVHIGFRNMTAFGHTGPAFLEIPFDVINDVTEDANLHEGLTRPEVAVLGDPEQVKKAAELLANAEKPLMLIGREAIYYPSNKEYVEKLCDYLMIPVGALFEAKGFYSDEHNFQYVLGMLGGAEADVIVLLDIFPDYIYDFLAAPNYNPNAKYIVINTDARRIGMNHDFDCGIIGTPGDVCKQIYELVEEMRDEADDYEWLGHLAEIGQQMQNPALDEDTASPINPQLAGKIVGQFFDDQDDWLVVVDGGDQAGNVTANTTIETGPKFLFESHFGGIGTALPMAIGAHYAEGKKILLATGDGSFGFYMGEIITAISRNIPLVIVMFNDSAWGMIKGMEQRMHGDVLAKYEKEHKYGYAMNLPEQFRYDKVVEAAGGYGELVTDIAELPAALERAKESGKVALVNIITRDMTNEDIHAFGTVTYSAQFKDYIKY